MTRMITWMITMTSSDDMQFSSIVFALIKQMRDAFVLKQLMGLLYPVLDVRNYDKREG